MTATTIPALLAATVDRVGDRVAVVDGGRSLTYSELDGAARAFGAALVASDVGPGDRVAVWAPNSAPWIVAALGTWVVGATLVPVNTRFKGPEAADILARTEARVLVTVTDFLGTDYLAMLAGAERDLPDLGVAVVIAGPVPDGHRWETCSWDDFGTRAGDPGAAARAEVADRAGAVGTDDVSDILFTSGTTGRSKGVVQTHGRTLRVATDWVAMTDLAAGDRYLMINPYFHMFGLKAGILASVAAGATMYPEPTFDVDRVLSAIESEAITVLPGAPTIYQTILDAPDRRHHDLSSLRVAVTGAADIPVELIRRVHDELPFTVIVTGYGLTEGGTAAATAPGDAPETIATTVGRPRPGFELRLVATDGDEHSATDVGAGEVGEIVLRGGSIMSHYLDDPEATRQTLSDDGWLRTGDLGVIGDDGCLRIVGRSKDMFIVGGFNAYPAEIENALSDHADIAQVAVIGIPDPRLGEVGMAFVVPRPGAEPTEDELVVWSRERMANYKVPRRVEFVDELPINATGKVVKDELRDRARQS